MAGREEQKRRDWHIERAVAAAKRDLAEKVLAAIESAPTTVTLKSEHCEGAAFFKDDIYAAVRQVFTESGVAVEQEG